MVNRYRGEVVLVLNGQTHVMRLTLGALAELEEALGSDSLLAMVQRFETGQFRARDVLALLVAGLRGGGWRGAPDELAQGEIQGGRRRRRRRRRRCWLALLRPWMVGPRPWIGRV